MKKLLSLTLVSALMLISCGGHSESKAEAEIAQEAVVLQDTIAKDFATLQVEKYKEYGITGLAIDSLQFVVESNVKIDPKAFENEESCLNDLRFYGWTDDDWCNNNYIRTIRIFMDAYAAGEVGEEFLKNVQMEELDKDKCDLCASVMNSKFVIVEMDFPMLGGIMYYIVPLDNPKLVISAWVYSFVVEDTITGYDLRLFEVREYDVEFISKEEVAKLRAGEMECIVW